MDEYRLSNSQDPPPYAVYMMGDFSRRQSTVSFTGVPVRAWDPKGVKIPPPPPLPPAPPPTPTPSLYSRPRSTSLRQENEVISWSGRAREFCRTTSLHTLHYVSDMQRNSLERVFWFSMFSLSVCLCFPSVWEVWRKWRDESVVVVLHQSAWPVWKVPFPEFTICNEMGVRYAALQPEMVKEDPVLRTLTNNEMEAASLFCHNASIDQKTRFIKHEEVYKFIRLAHVPCKNFMDDCSFNGNTVDCCKVFQPRFTVYGLCFSFNALPYYNLFTNQMAPGVGKEDDDPPENMLWSPERGYSKEWSPRQAIPERVLGDGLRYGLSVRLFRNLSETHPSCSPPNAGFKVAVTTPSDVSPNTGDFLRLPMGRDTSLLLTPSLVLTWESMRAVLPKLRTCFFDAERDLRFFQFYTQKNCYLECFANRSLSICGCVAIYMPRLTNASICIGKEERKCIRDVNERMFQERAEGVLRSTYQNDDEDPVSDTNPCDCLPACTAHDYNMETFSGDLLTANDNTAVVHLFFKRYDFFPLVRKKQYDALDFISNCGGLLGLFLGFSLLSGVEVIYFLILSPLLRTIKAALKRRTKPKPPPAPPQSSVKR